MVNLEGFLLGLYRNPMHGTQNKKLIDRCDEKGILIIEEVNVRELTTPDYPLAKQWLREMIERDCNHPSIIGWSVGNELLWIW